MATESTALPTPPKPLRRTWRQWFRLARVRIGFVVLLICLISTTMTVWARCGILLITLMGGEVDVPVRVTRTIPGMTFVRRWFVNRPMIERDIHRLLFGKDFDVEIVHLQEINPKLLFPSILGRFPNVQYITMNARSLSPLCTQLAKNHHVKGVWILGLESSHDLGCLSSIGSLKNVALEHCPITGGGFENLVKLTSVNRFCFDTRPTHEALNGVAKATSIKELNLQRGIRNDDDLAALASSRHLLDLRSNGTYNGGAAALKHISHIKSLQVLVISPTLASDDDLLVLDQLTNLEFLRLSGPNLTTSGIDRLREKLPNCEIDGP